MTLPQIKPEYVAFAATIALRRWEATAAFVALIAAKCLNDYFQRFSVARLEKLESEIRSVRNGMAFK